MAAKFWQLLPWPRQLDRAWRRESKSFRRTRMSLLNHLNGALSEKSLFERVTRRYFQSPTKEGSLLISWLGRTPTLKFVRTSKSKGSWRLSEKLLIKNFEALSALSLNSCSYSACRIKVPLSANRYSDSIASPRASSRKLKQLRINNKI